MKEVTSTKSGKAFLSLDAKVGGREIWLSPEAVTEVLANTDKARAWLAGQNSKPAVAKDSEIEALKAQVAALTRLIQPAPNSGNGGGRFNPNIQPAQA